MLLFLSITFKMSEYNSNYRVAKIFANLLLHTVQVLIEFFLMIILINITFNCFRNRAGASVVHFYNYVE